MTLYMVFEHMKQDLATYIEQCPKPGMSSDVIKVIIKNVYITNVIIKYLYKYILVIGSISILVLVEIKSHNILLHSSIL